MACNQEEKDVPGPESSEAGKETWSRRQRTGGGGDRRPQHGGILGKPGQEKNPGQLPGRRIHSARARHPLAVPDRRRGHPESLRDIPLRRTEEDGDKRVVVDRVTDAEHHLPTQGRRGGACLLFPVGDAAPYFKGIFLTEFPEVLRSRAEGLGGGKGGLTICLEQGFSSPRVVVDRSAPKSCKKLPEMIKAMTVVRANRGSVADRVGCNELLPRETFQQFLSLEKDRIQSVSQPPHAQKGRSFPMKGMSLRCKKRTIAEQNATVTASPKSSP